MRESTAIDASRKRARTGVAKKIPVALAVGLAAVATSTVAADPAAAGSGDSSYVLDQTNIRICGSLRPLSCGQNTNAVIGSVSGDQWAPTWCYKDGEWVGDTNRWFKITARSWNGTKTGWVIASQVPRQASVPRCANWQ